MNLLPFDLQKALAGAKLVTRDRREARDFRALRGAAKETRQPFMATIDIRYKETVDFYYTANGTWEPYDESESEYDLFLLDDASEAPAHQASAIVPLGPDDVPPGSVVRWATGQSSGWVNIDFVALDGLWVPSDQESVHWSWERLREKCEILRPGGKWERCEKPAPPAPEAAPEHKCNCGQYTFKHPEGWSATGPMGFHHTRHKGERCGYFTELELLSLCGGRLPHRMDWRREYLPPVDDGGLPWRPLLEGEDCVSSEMLDNGSWHKIIVRSVACPKMRHGRTRKPLPAEEKPGEPEDEDDGPMRSSIGSVLSELQEFDQPLGRNYYLTVIHGVEVDVYDILAAYDVTSHPVAHALKKLLRLGKGHKSPEQDVQEAIASLQRHLELYAQTTPPHNS